MLSSTGTGASATVYHIIYLQTIRAPRISILSLRRACPERSRRNLCIGLFCCLSGCHSAAQRRNLLLAFAFLFVIPQEPALSLPKEPASRRHPDPERSRRGRTPVFALASLIHHPNPTPTTPHPTYRSKISPRWKDCVLRFTNHSEISQEHSCTRKSASPCEDNPSIIRYLDNKSLIIINLQPLSGEFNP
jgi:hypothetical protein